MHLLLARRQPLRYLRDILFRVFVPRRFVQRILGLGLSGIGIRYAALQSAGKAAGARVPDIELRGTDFQAIRLYELLRSSDYALIIFLSATQVNDQRPALLQLLALATRDSVVAHVVLDAGLSKQHNLGTDVLIDYKGELEQKLSARPGSVFLLRPDAYVAFECRSLNTEDFDSEWQRWIMPHPPR